MDELELQKECWLLKASSVNCSHTLKNFFYGGNNHIKAVQNPYFDSFSTTIANVSATTAFTNYSYDSLGRVTNVTNPDATVARVVFDRQLISTYDENGHRKDYWLDAYDRIVRVQEYNIDSVLGDGVVHGFNTTYAYDVTDQLVQVNDTYGNQFGFVYDSLGRRTKLSDPDVGEWNYTYDLANNLISQAGGGGNLVTGDGFYREYNSLNQLTRIRNGSSATSPLLEQYFYDPFNERIKIWRNDTAGTTVYTPFREFMQVRNSSGIYNYTYVYDGSTLVARVNPDQSVHYYHPDHLGSTTLITDQSGNVVEETFYEPFGAVTSGGTADVKLYTGQFSDEATGQYYYRARYYMPGIGVYGAADPLYSDLSKYPHSQVMLLYDPQRLNKYSYVLNNPYRYTDPTGLWTLQLGGSVSGGAGIGGSGGVGTIFGYSKSGGFQFGFYASAGGGMHAGISASASGDVSFSPSNDYINDVGGESEVLGASVPAFGFDVEPADEENDEEDKEAVFKGTLSGHIGLGAGADVHIYKTHTAVGQLLGGRKEGGQSRGGSNLVQRGDGHWVREGSSDDDGTRTNNDKLINKENGG